MDEILYKVESLRLTDEEVGRLAARILNTTTMPIGTYEAFKEELDDDNWTELSSRIEDGD